MIKRDWTPRLCNRMPHRAILPDLTKTKSKAIMLAMQMAIRQKTKSTVIFTPV